MTNLYKVTVATNQRYLRGQYLQLTALLLVYYSKLGQLNNKNISMPQHIVFLANKVHSPVTQSL